MTQQELAKKVGCTYQAIQKYEKQDIFKIRLDILQRIARGLNVSVDELTNTEGSKSMQQVLKIAEYLGDIFLVLNRGTRK